MGMEEGFLSIAGRLFSPCNLYLWPLPLSMVYCTWATWTFLWIPQTHLAHSHLRAVALALPSTQKALPLGLCMPGFFRFFRYELKRHLCGELFPDHQLQLANLSITSAPTQREPNLSVTFSVLLSSWNSLLLEIVWLIYFLLVCSFSSPSKHKLCESRVLLCSVHCHILSSIAGTWYKCHEYLLNEQMIKWTYFFPPWSWRVFFLYNIMFSWRHSEWVRHRQKYSCQKDSSLVWQRAL